MEMKDWIRAARLHAKLTQEQLAERVGLTKGNISAWENGRHEASHDQLVKLASITGYSGQFIGLGAQASPSKSQWPFKAISEEKVRRLNSYDMGRLETAVLAFAEKYNLDIAGDQFGPDVRKD